MKRMSNLGSGNYSEVIMLTKNLRSAIANTLKYIDQNLDRARQHYLNKDYAGSIIFSTLVIEELGRYQVYLDALKNGDNITRRIMTKLNNHDYKNLVLAKHLFGNPRDKFIELVNRDKFEDW